MTNSIFSPQKNKKKKKTNTLYNKCNSEYIENDDIHNSYKWWQWLMPNGIVACAQFYDCLRSILNIVLLLFFFLKKSISQDHKFKWILVGGYYYS